MTKTVILGLVMMLLYGCSAQQQLDWNESWENHGGVEAARNCMALSPANVYENTKNEGFWTRLLTMAISVGVQLNGGAMACSIVSATEATTGIHSTGSVANTKRIRP